MVAGMDRQRLLAQADWSLVGTWNATRTRHAGPRCHAQGEPSVTDRRAITITWNVDDASEEPDVALGPGVSMYEAAHVLHTALDRVWDLAPAARVHMGGDEIFADGELWED